MLYILLIAEKSEVKGELFRVTVAPDVDQRGTAMRNHERHAKPRTTPATGDWPFSCPFTRGALSSPVNRILSYAPNGNLWL